MIAEAPSAKAQEQAITLATIRGRVSFFGGLPMTAPCACNVLLRNVTLGTSRPVGPDPRQTGLSTTRGPYRSR